MLEFAETEIETTWTLSQEKKTIFYTKLKSENLQMKERPALSLAKV